MSEAPVIIVIGGGPAGLSAAVTLARSGMRVLLAEQRDRLGGAIHRQPANGNTPQVMRQAGHVHAWSRLMSEFAALRTHITLATSTVFVGVDAAGFVLLDNRRSGELLALRPTGMVLALGGTEIVHPFPGWELPGVFSAGGAQVLLKETGRPLDGRTLIAGSGPLLLALGAQLCAVRRPPLAVLERSSLLNRPTAALAMLRSPRNFFEGSGYATRLALARVPYRTGAQVVSVTQREAGLTIETVRHGRRTTYDVDNLVVHDGIRSGHQSVDVSNLPFPTAEAGDGREILGAHCAMADGRLASAKLLSLFGKTVVSTAADERVVLAARRFQGRLSTLFAEPPPPIRPDAILCRCEGRRADTLTIGTSPREAKLIGRFGMGACQGRFCAEATMRALGNHGIVSDFRPAVMRWPIRPLSAVSLARLRHVSNDFEKIWNDDGTIA
jgi:D-hydroxyproline dehydrogenase subunit alpha